MPVMYCAGPDCSRLISVSAIPGGNPTALADPEHWAVQWRHCSSCQQYWCDRCWQKHPSIARQQLCPTDGKSLVGPSTDHAINMIVPKTEPGKSPTGPGKIAFGIFAGITGYHLLMFLLGRAGLHLIPNNLYRAVNLVEIAVRLTGWIFFAVWIYRATIAVRAAGQKTTYSPGMSVGCWFIPFANAVMPFIAVRDVCRTTLPAENHWLAPLWWISYLLTTLLTVAQPYLWRLIPMGALSIVSYLSFAALLSAYGSWAAILFLNTRESQGGAVVPA